MKQGAHAGNLIKAIAGNVGGGGGGRPNMAQAGKESGGDSGCHCTGEDGTGKHVEIICNGTYKRIEKTQKTGKKAQ